MDPVLCSVDMNSQTEKDQRSLSGGPLGPARKAILQIHPSLRCNLHCPHCYSNSEINSAVALPVATVCQTISDAAELGYEVVSLSGGEPLMYEGLVEVLSHAKSLGLVTTVTSNGFLLTPKLFKPLVGLIDVLALSLDGNAAEHNRLRGSRHAFERVEAAADTASALGQPFGFIHTLTGGNWHHLPSLAEYAATRGASLLQVHPLELTGRAQQELSNQALDDAALAKTYIVGAALAAIYQGSMRVQVDLISRAELCAEPELVYATPPEESGGLSARGLGVIVLEPDGSIVPLAYGFSRRYQVCAVPRERLLGAWENFSRFGYAKLRALCCDAWRELTCPDAQLVSNWHEKIVGLSHSTAS